MFLAANKLNKIHFLFPLVYWACSHARLNQPFSDTVLESIFVGNRQQTQFNCKTLLRKASFLQLQACKEPLEFRESSQSTITPTQSMKEFCFIGSRSRFKGKACSSTPTEAPTCPTPQTPIALMATFPHCCSTPGVPGSEDSGFISRV